MVIVVLKLLLPCADIDPEFLVTAESDMSFFLQLVILSFLAGACSQGSSSSSKRGASADSGGGDGKAGGGQGTDTSTGSGATDAGDLGALFGGAGGAGVAGTAGNPGGATAGATTAGGTGTSAPKSGGPIVWTKKSWITLPAAGSGNKALAGDAFSFLSFRSNDPAPDRGHYNQSAPPVSDFECPGDSFLSGQKSFYKAGASDRTYQDRCQFLQDSAGVSVRRGSCEEHQAAGPGRSFSEFKCPAGKFLAGHKSTPVYEESDAFSNESRPYDRLHFFKCCSMSTESGQSIEWSASTPDVPNCEASMNSTQAKLINPLGANTAINPAKEMVNFVCDTDMILKSMDGNYIKANGTLGEEGHADRMWSFECCRINVKVK